MRPSLLSTIIISLLGGATPAVAEGWPQHEVRFLVPFPPAGPADLAARVLGQALSAKWGQPVIVENRPGAGGNLGAIQVARAKPDGHMVLVTTSNFIVNAVVYKNPGYLLDAFRGVAMAGTTPELLVGAPNLHENTLPEILSAARQKRLSYGSTGLGTPPHLLGELVFAERSKVDLTHVPFNGAAPAVNAAMGGQVDLAILALPPVAELIRAGKLKAIAVSTPERLADFPEVPTFKEAGLDVQAEAAVLLAAPAATPDAIVAKINADVNELVTSGQLDRSLASAGLRPSTLSPKELDDYIRTESKTWGSLARSLGIQIE